MVYFTNVSEPHAKLVEHMRDFAFYEADLVGDRVRIYNITSQIRNKRFRDTLEFVVDTVRGENVDLVVVDSFRGLKHVLDVSVRERDLMVSFQENPEQLALRAAQFGLEEQLDIGGGRTEVLFLSPVELDLDQAAASIREAVESRAVQRVVIDSVAELEFAVRDPERFDDFLASLVGFLRGHEVTTLMTREITQIFGSELTIASRGLSYIVDNIVLLRYIELAAEIRRALAVLKIRGSDHDKALREIVFADGQVTIGRRFQGLTGIITGIPHVVNMSPLEGRAHAEER